MTQNQIAYWAQRSKQNLEESQASKAKAETEKAKHDIVQGYYKNYPGSDVVKASAGAVIAKQLGVSEPGNIAKQEAVDTAKDVVSAVKEGVSSVKRVIRGKSSGKNGSFHGGGSGFSGGGGGGRR